MREVCELLEKNKEFNIKYFDISYKGIEEVIKEQNVTVCGYKKSISSERFQFINNNQSTINYTVLYFLSFSYL